MAELDADEAREQARQVLEGDRFQSREVPRPFRGALGWVGERIEDLARPVADLLSTPQGLAVALVLVAAATAVVVVGAVRRRTRRAEQHQARRARETRPDPARLVAEAEAAEAVGDLSAAVRLRFRAGVLELEQGGAVAPRADATTGRLVRAIPSPRFGELARSFDEVAYGGRAATADDVRRARSDWPLVIDAATTRRGPAAVPESAEGPDASAPSEVPA